MEWRLHFWPELADNHCVKIHYRYRQSPEQFELRLVDSELRWGFCLVLGLSFSGVVNILLQHLIEHWTLLITPEFKCRGQSLLLLYLERHFCLLSIQALVLVVIMAYYKRASNHSAATTLTCFYASHIPTGISAWRLICVGLCYEYNEKTWKNYAIQIACSVFSSKLPNHIQAMFQY